MIWFYPSYTLQENNLNKSGVVLVFFFNNEADDAVKKGKTIFISIFAAKPLINHNIAYIRETWYDSWTLIFVWETTNPDL